MKYFLILVFFLSIISCNNNPSEIAIKEITQLESNKNLMHSDSMYKTYIRFVDAYPENDSAVIYLFKAAQLSIKMNHIVVGARLYERLATEYKSDKRAPESLIRGGIAFASMNDAANAKRLYDLFISSFPNHPRIEEVKMWSETSGMTEEQLMKRFNEKLRERDSIVQ